MGTIVCQDCNRTIEHYDDHKVTILYASTCESCEKENK
ncbi:GapA-binding peptide SR1P [Alteribacillus iranensis]|nr:GapA-binding peptide SR1P [Alteribacillus iranensis]